MAHLYSDTDPKMEALHLQLLRGATPAQKMHMLGELNATARLLALRGLRARHPKASPTQLHRSLARLLLGPELAARFLGKSEDAA